MLAGRRWLFDVLLAAMKEEGVSTVPQSPLLVLCFTWFPDLLEVRLFHLGFWPLPSLLILSLPSVSDIPQPNAGIASLYAITRDIRYIADTMTVTNTHGSCGYVSYC